MNVLVNSWLNALLKKESHLSCFWSHETKPNCLGLHTSFPSGHLSGACRQPKSPSSAWGHLPFVEYKLAFGEIFRRDLEFFTCPWTRICVCWAPQTGSIPFPGLRALMNRWYKGITLLWGSSEFTADTMPKGQFLSLFIFFYFGCCMWKFSSQGSKPSHSSDEVGP